MLRRSMRPNYDRGDESLGSACEHDRHMNVQPSCWTPYLPPRKFTADSTSRPNGCCVDPRNARRRSSFHAQMSHGSPLDRSEHHLIRMIRDRGRAAMMQNCDPARVIAASTAAPTDGRRACRRAGGVPPAREADRGRCATSTAPTASSCPRRCCTRAAASAWPTSCSRPTSGS